jgi:hypothetical protein
VLKDGIGTFDNQGGPAARTEWTMLERRRVGEEFLTQ